MDPDRYRLPRTVVPRHYDIALAPDLEAARFDGNVTIHISVATPTHQVVLNAAELDVHAAVITDATHSSQDGKVEHDTDLERITVTFSKQIGAGDATLTLAFTGRLNDDLRGFYRSTFTDDLGAQRVIATTQFESTDARRAFPCWDEPSFKASFSVSLLVPDGLLGLSNGPAISTRQIDGGAWVMFQKTMVMSTYLVAFIVGPLVVTDPVDVDGVPLRVACVPGREHLSQFALEVGAHALRFFAKYFDIRYPAAKLDMVALPDFAFGAMENLGCVTFRETALLVDSNASSHVELERVADVVSHEIAHMWFGDLVTMKWWNGIWLNEAFATFMEVTAVDAFRPEWDRWATFGIERGGAMVTDGLEATRPIEYEVVSPEDAEGMFDGLTYQKGGAVLRMLETYLGPARFREGIRLYLKRHSYSNTETTDLWDAIEEATGEPVRAIMDSWIFQGGHPLVSVTQSGGRVTLSQQRFRYLDGSDRSAALWQVPVLLRPLDRDEPARTLLSAGSASLGFDDTPVVVNAGGWGTFRSRYAPELFARIIGSLDHVTPLERYNLVSDTWAMALSNQADLGEFADLVRMLGKTHEMSSPVWEAALGGLDLMHREIASPVRSGLSEFVARTLGPTFASVGWTPTAEEGAGLNKLRGVLVEALGTIGDDETITARALEMAEAGDVPPDLAGPVMSIVAWNGGPLEYERFWDHVRAAATPQEEIRYLMRLPDFRDPSLLERTLDAVLTDVRSQNGAQVISRSLANRWSGKEAWMWLVKHWDDVVKRLPKNSHGRMLGGIVTLTEPEYVTATADWLRAHPIPSAGKQVDQLLERQRVNAAFGAGHQAALASSFGRSSTGGRSSPATA